MGLDENGKVKEKNEMQPVIINPSPVSGTFLITHLFLYFHI